MFLLHFTVIYHHIVSVWWAHYIMVTHVLFSRSDHTCPFRYLAVKRDILGFFLSVSWLSPSREASCHVFRMHRHPMDRPVWQGNEVSILQPDCSWGLPTTTWGWSLQMTSVSADSFTTASWKTLSRNQPVKPHPGINGYYSSKAS